MTIAAALLVALAVAMSAAAASAHVAGDQVVVPHGGPVQIAVVLDKSDSVGATYFAGIRNAIQMAVDLHPAIHGVPVKLNDGFDAPCLGDAAFAQNAADANAVVANPQNVGGDRPPVLRPVRRHDRRRSVSESLERQRPLDLREQRGHRDQWQHH